MTQAVLGTLFVSIAFALLCAFRFPNSRGLSDARRDTFLSAWSYSPSPLLSAYSLTLWNKQPIKSI